MPHRRFDWHERIKAVEREYWSARIAVDRLTREVTGDASILGTGPRPRDLEATGEHLEGTYLVRMFTEFETGVRSYWRWVKHDTKRRTPAEIMLGRVADLHKIPDDVIRGPHDVRLYRNWLVHGDEEAESVTIKDARRFLATYFARLPEGWGG